MNININKQFTEENIFGNPYNYSLNEMITVMGEERAKSFLKHYIKLRLSLKIKRLRLRIFIAVEILASMFFN